MYRLEDPVTVRIPVERGVDEVTHGSVQNYFGQE